MPNRLLARTSRIFDRSTVHTVHTVHVLGHQLAAICMWPDRWVHLLNAWRRSYSQVGDLQHLSSSDLSFGAHIAFSMVLWFSTRRHGHFLACQSPSRSLRRLCCHLNPASSDHCLPTNTVIRPLYLRAIYIMTLRWWSCALILRPATPRP